MATPSHTVSESTFKMPDGHEVYTKTVSPEGPIKARMLFIHGFSDHCNLDQWYFPYLASKGIKVYAFDQRGWGRSVHDPSERGLAGGTELVMSDLTAYARHVQPLESEPIFLMGHSMGGGEVLFYADKGPKDVLSKFRGIMCEAPWIALHPKTQPWRSTIAFGRLGARIMPHFKLKNPLDPKLVCRDLEVGKKFKADPLCHETGTLETMGGCLDRAAALEDGDVKVPEGICEGGKTRLWIGHGTSDFITSFDATKKSFERFEVQDKTLKEYDGWYHVLHAEPGNDKVTYANDVANWILERSGTL